MFNFLLPLQGQKTLCALTLVPWIQEGSQPVIQRMHPVWGASDMRRRTPAFTSLSSCNTRKVLIYGPLMYVQLLQDSQGGQGRDSLGEY